VGEADAPPIVVYRPPAGVSYRCVCPAAGEVWAGRDDGAVCRHRPTGGPPDRTHRVFETAVVGVARSADGRRVAAGDATGVVRVVDADSGRVVVGLSAAHRDGVPAVAFLLGGGLVTGSRDQTVKLWDASGREVLTLPQTGPVRRVFASADGTTLTLLAEGERGLRRWHLDRLRAELAELGLDW
jgi:WD40 repeat protein